MSDSLYLVKLYNNNHEMIVSIWDTREGAQKEREHIQSKIKNSYYSNYYCGIDIKSKNTPFKI